MNDPKPSSGFAGSSFVRFFHWLFSWRVIRCMLIVLAWTATLVALLYAEENWRGRRAWNKYRQELEARGEQLDLKAFIPKPVPDEQNFAATPFVNLWFTERANLEERWKDNYSRVIGKISSSGAKQDKGNRHFTDLVAWEMAFAALRTGETNLRKFGKFESAKLDRDSRATAAPAVMTSLKDGAAKMEELRGASQRRYSRYPVFYDLENPWGILLPHLANIKSACTRLQLKACAELAAGRNENGFEDVKLMLYLAESVKEEPFVISYIVRIACINIATQPIWEGLAEHRWSDVQLQELQARLQQDNFLADLKQPLDSERAAGILTVNLVRKKGLGYLVAIGEPEGSLPESHTAATLISPFIPSGWYYLEQRNYCRLFEEQKEGTFDLTQKTVSPKQSEANAKELERQVAGGRFGKDFNAILHHRVMASLLLPALNKLTRRSATAQTAVDQAALACALERYRLTHGQFPEQLELLVPAFMEKLPHDVITGKAFAYRRTEDGQFLLYSVGWDEKDDAGMPGKDLFAEKQGDWVWKYPAK